MGLIQTVKNRGPLWVAANLFFAVIDKFISWALYPIVIIAYGPLIGTALMMLLSFFYCWALIVGYDRLASTWWRDLFGFETIKKSGWRIRACVRRWIGSRSYVATMRTRWFKAVAAFGNVVTFFAVSFGADPMTYLVLARPLNRYGMGRREWMLFTVSVLASCSLWALMIYLGLESAWDVAPELLERVTEWVRNVMPGT